MICHYPNTGSRFILVEENIPRGTTNQKHHPDLGGVVASANISCFLRLAKPSFMEKKKLPVAEGPPPPPPAPPQPSEI